MDKGHIKRLWTTPQGLHVEYFETEGTTMPNDRDTHFLGFADLLLREILLDVPLSGQDMLVRQAIQTLIAQRAYDLLYFLIDKAPYHSGSFDAGYGTADEIREVIERLPDLTQWPD